MPELPEVETLRLSLAAVQGQAISGVRVLEPRLRSFVDVARLQDHLVNRRVEGIDRRSKYLIFCMQGGNRLIIHLGMSGRLSLASPEQPTTKHLHVVFALDSGLEMRFVDPRRFGIVETVTQAEQPSYRRFQKLGIEPLTRACNARYLYELSRGSKKPIKNFIMDASKVVGVGNIYACEALFVAGVHPQAIAGKLTLLRWQRLSRAIKSVLRKAIKVGGTTINDFHDGEGNSGYFQLYLRVYDREGEPCRRCKRPVKRVVLAGRSTYYCGRCQRV